MRIPPLPSVMVEKFGSMAAAYIREQHVRYASRAVLLNARQRQVVENLFRDDLLESVRVVVLEGERVHEPKFLAQLGRVALGLPNAESTAAITFDNVLVAHGAFSMSLLFHELVHVEQYRQLGIDRFAELYVRGF